MPHLFKLEKPVEIIFLRVYNGIAKKNNTVHRIFPLSGITSDDKEIAVGICSNSHYRISQKRQVGMLIGLCTIKVPWADGGRNRQSGQAGARITSFRTP